MGFWADLFGTSPEAKEIKRRARRKATIDGQTRIIAKYQLLLKSLEKGTSTYANAERRLEEAKKKLQEAKTNS